MSKNFPEKTFISSREEDGKKEDQQETNKV